MFFFCYCLVLVFFYEKLISKWVFNFPLTLHDKSELKLALSFPPKSFCHFPFGVEMKPKAYVIMEKGRKKKKRQIFLSLNRPISIIKRKLCYQWWIRRQWRNKETRCIIIVIAFRLWDPHYHLQVRQLRLHSPTCLTHTCHLPLATCHSATDGYCTVLSPFKCKFQLPEVAA